MCPNRGRKRRSARFFISDAQTSAVLSAGETTLFDVWGQLQQTAAVSGQGFACLPRPLVAIVSTYYVTFGEVRTLTAVGAYVLNDEGPCERVGFQAPYPPCFGKDDDELFVPAYGSHRVVMINRKANMVTVVAGKQGQGHQDGPAAQSKSSGSPTVPI